MEGTLWKWTNYFSGWQPRWFVLENGILSYYKSQEDVDNGCKGSIKMSVCDVTVHHSDASRLDLIIPGEAHFYVKAATPQERQHWLVALGTAKAGQANGRHTPIKEEVPDESLKAKKSELRLYCDLLMQQVHSVKTAVQVKEGGPDIGMDEATSLLSATCDTFIHALDECMQIAAASTSPLTVSPTNVPASPSRKSPSSRSVPWPTSVPPVQRSLSVDSSSLKSSRHRSASPEDTIVRGYIPGRRGSRSGHQRGSVVRTISESSDPTSAPPASPIVAPADNHIGESSHTAGAEAAVINGGDRIPTFFSDMKTTFQDVAVDSDGNIPTEVFLEACRSILPIFDKLSPTAFAPVMYDISGNIKKIHQKFLSDRGCFDCLQNMVLYEVGAKQQQHSSSATVALLWLKRALEFIVEFCVELLAGTDDLTTASNKAYTKTLKPFHNFVNRGAYALASKSIPSKTEFLGHLLSSSSSITMTSADPSVELLIKASLADYITSLQRVTQALHAFFSQSQLDSPEMV